MRILVTGATGFIGRAVAEALVREGHDVVHAGRHGPVRVDFAHPPGSAWWLPHLRDVDAVVNAVGILRERGAQRFEALHTRAPAELFEACAQAGVRCVVQVSALGADEHATSEYHLSKRRADDVLRALPGAGAIVQPSLVYGPGGESASLFNRLAVMPLVPMPRSGAIDVQPVHLGDVVAGIVAILRDPPPERPTIAFVGPRRMSLRDYLAGLRQGLGLRSPLRMEPLPEPLFHAGAAVAGLLPSSFLDRDTARMLLRGNTADAREFERLLGRAPRDVDAFIPACERPALRTAAMLGVWLPVLRVALAFMWIVTGIVSLGAYPVRDSLALLARVGLHGAPATAALYGAAWLDLALGLLTLAAPGRWRAAVWAAQLALVAAYTLLITVFLPEYWLHPYGPITKNLPIMAAIALLWALEDRR